MLRLKDLLSLSFFFLKITYLITHSVWQALSGYRDEQDRVPVFGAYVRIEKIDFKLIIVGQWVLWKAIICLQSMWFLCNREFSLPFWILLELETWLAWGRARVRLLERRGFLQLGGLGTYFDAFLWRLWSILVLVQNKTSLLGCIKWCGVSLHIWCSADGGPVESDPPLAGQV